MTVKMSEKYPPQKSLQEHLDKSEKIKNKSALNALKCIIFTHTDDV